MRSACYGRFVVDTNELLRQRAKRLVKLGCSQKSLAAAMGIAPSTFSKWINKKKGISAPSVDALDGFNAYVHRLADALQEKDPEAARPNEADQRTASARGVR